MDKPTFERIVIGKTLMEAQDIGTLYEFQVRPLIIDGKPQIVIQDRRANRLNVHVTNGKIIRTTQHPWG